MPNASSVTADTMDVAVENGIATAGAEVSAGSSSILLEKQMSKKLIHFLYSTIFWASLNGPFTL
jgi:hypothetical protein